MRSTLTDLLYRRYPRLYANPHLSIGQRLMPFGFEHEDGWFAMIDVLSGLLEPRGVVARQVKEKLGGLRYYYRGGDEEWCRGATQVATALSLKVCQLTGRRGRLMALGGLLMTVVPRAPRALFAGLDRRCLGAAATQPQYGQPCTGGCCLRFVSATRCAVRLDRPGRCFARGHPLEHRDRDPSNCAQSEWGVRGSLGYATRTVRTGGDGVRRCNGEADPPRQRLYRPDRRRGAPIMSAAVVTICSAPIAARSFACTWFGKGMR